MTDYGEYKIKELKGQYNRSDIKIWFLETKSKQTENNSLKRIRVFYEEKQMTRFAIFSALK